MKRKPTLRQQGALIAFQTASGRMEQFQRQRDRNGSQGDLWSLDASIAWWRSIQLEAAAVLRGARYAR